MIERLCGRHVVLLGIGHTNAHVLRMWRMGAPPDTDLTCISDNSIATYSGMLPARLAGQIDPDEMRIDLVRLCASVGARLITDPVAAIDHARQEVQFESRPAVSYDVLSVGVGSTASTDGVDVEGDSLVLIKPMQSFMHRLEKKVEQARQRTGRNELRIVVVGSGVAGIEITFCVSSYVQSVTGHSPTLRMVTRSSEIAPELLDRTRELVNEELDRRGVGVSVGAGVSRVTEQSVQLDNGQSFEADMVVWATGATPPALLSRLDLAKDERGFLATDHTLQSVSASGVFAVGDTGTIANDHLPKAGVYAVRQGPILWENIQRLLDGKQLKRYEPQRSFLKLINLGDGRAIGQWRKFAFAGSWVMKLKDSIDRRFMEKFNVEAMDGSDMGTDSGDDEMQCRGCGCKLGSDVLQSALERSPAVAFDDAAEIGDGDTLPLVASTDFFSSPLDDSYLAGRVAALHSASDIVATGAKVTQALANVVIPEGDRTTQQRVLGDFMQGAREEFEAMGAPIVGGHTIVGPRMEIGFTVIGKPFSEDLIRKRNLRSGDRLLLTKPLGIGILLAAHMRFECPAHAFETLMDAILLRQHVIAEIAVECGIDAGTDVTGFGLAGHLMEMLDASDMAAEVDLNAVPMLPGAVEAARSGIGSSLLPDNRKVDRTMSAEDAVRDRPEYELLFDPQTSGGLLLGVREEQVDHFIERVTGAGLPAPVCIGRVHPSEAGKKRLTVIA